MVEPDKDFNGFQLRGFLNLGIVIWFLIHGFLYYFQGEGIDYYEESWIKYIKYFSAISFLAINCRSVSALRMFGVALLLLFFGGLQSARAIWTGETPNVQLFSNFYTAIPLFAIRPQFFTRDVCMKIVSAVFAFSCAFILVEYCFLQTRVANNNYVSNYGFYRASSCFMSPNTCGAMFCFMSYFFVANFESMKHRFWGAMVVFLSGSAIVLTGSRAALAVFALLVFPLFLMRTVGHKRVFVFTAIALVIVACIATNVLINMEDLPVDRVDAGMSSDLRADQVGMLIDSVTRDLLFPVSVVDYRSDCGWFQLYYDFGLLGLLFIVAAFVWCWFRFADFYDRFFIFLFALFSVTQVAEYLHPYVYVLVVFLSSRIEKYSDQDDRARQVCGTKLKLNAKGRS